jgi:methionyl aminopeptidase
MIAKTEEEIKNLRRAGAALGEILKEVSLLIHPGVSAAELDEAAQKGIEARGCVSAFYGYKQEGSAYPFPAKLCVTLNDEVVHGIPTEETNFKRGRYCDARPWALLQWLLC